MSPPIAPQGDYAELSQLAARISQYLLKHPRDSQARQDLHYVVMQMQGPTGATRAANVEERAAMVGPESLHPGAEVTAGLTQAALDVPRGILQSVATGAGRRHAIGQLTGVGNWSHIGETFRDPEANWAEKADAIARAIPLLNLGYIPERGLLEATGAKSDTPASVQEQAHRAGNVASLMLLGVNRNTPGVRMAGRIAGKIPLVGPLMRGAAEMARRAPDATPPVRGLLGVGEDIGTSAQRPPPTIAPPPEPMDIATYLRRQQAPAPVAAPPSPSVAGVPEWWTRQAALAKGVLPENVDAFLTRQGPAPGPTPMAPQGLLAPEAAPPNPLLLTAAEQATNLGAKALAAQMRDAARAAYRVAIASGQTPAQALLASRRAAAALQATVQGAVR